MYILGLTTMGDAAATLIKDGEPIAAVEEERFSRIKHHVGFPYHSVDYCLKEAGITLKDVTHVGLYWKPWVLGRRVLLALGELRNSRARFVARMERGSEQIGRHYRLMFSMKGHLRKHFGDSNFRFHYLDHHLCHAASGFFVSPFERAAVLTADGTGENTTTMFALGEGTRLQILRRIRLPHSLGQFYSAITNFLGFDMMQGDEWKVMGLAGWGEPEFYDYFIRNILVPTDGTGFRLNISILDHHLARHYTFSPEFLQMMGPNRRPGEEITERHRNIAATAQRVLEDVVLQLLGWLYGATKERNLCLTGGVMFNSMMNGRIIRESPFENFFIQPAAGDAGCALGAAYYIYHAILHRPRTHRMTHAYLGPAYSPGECGQALDARGLSYQTLSKEALVQQVAQLLSEGNIIAWFQGRMEWGPRALGNRSFLADPRDPQMREKLNKKVKLREWFRPLAPSILEEASPHVFGEPRHDPFMVTVFPVAENMKTRIPAVVHVDGTARPQTVSRETNPTYWQLIKEFEKLTGIPALLNTSFNIQEPIVCTPEDAIDCFLRSQLDYLVLEDKLVVKNG